MAENVIRKDVIQLGFEIDNAPLASLTKELNSVKKVLQGAFGDDVFDDMTDGAEKAQKPIEGIGDSAKKAKKPLDELPKPLKDTEEQGEKAHKPLRNIAKETFSKTTSGLKKVSGVLGTVATKAAKISFAGIGATAAGIGKIAYEATQAFGEYEQLKGGMEKIFDKADMKGIMTDANNAYKTLGLSANDYLRVINDTGANFASTMGDQKGYETAKTGLTAISDYASGTGKSVDVLSEKFAMITRASSSYQSIADQFSGILPATSADFLKQAKAAGFLEKKYTKLTDVPIAEYQGAVSKMLEKGVKDLGLAGNTAFEAEKTFSGSLGMMKASWGNLLSAIGSGEGLDQCFDNMVHSAEVFGNQLIPILERSLDGIGIVVEKLVPKISEKLPSLADKLLPPLIKSAVSLAGGLVKALPSIVKTVFSTLADICKTEIPILGKAFTGLENASGTIAKFIPYALGLAGALMAFTRVKSAISVVSGLFGGGKDESGGKGKGKQKGGIIDTLAKMKPTTILKAMANIGLIVGGLTVMTAGIMAIAPHMAKLTDAKSFVEVIGCMAAVGAVGVAMSHFAGAVGKIPVSTVAKGLANIAIVVGGMSALYLLVGAVSLVNFDLTRILKISAVMGVLGTVGAAMSVFAGIAGLIPIPVVLTGLANIALVVGGMSALIVAFGKLSEIPKFNEFISSGGETLANVFNQIGKIGGSLISGLGEGLSKSLPEIGKNLSLFATSLKPMFTMFSGADMSGIGTFFKAMGAFMVQMAGEKLLSFFTGGTNFAELGTQLNTFATSSKGFFTEVAKFPENGFTNATRLFDCLAGMKSLPKEGGIVGWFNGGINYQSLANGLKQLSSEKVVNFFTAIQGIQQAGFDNATKLFDCLANMKSLPKEGGLVGWFSGGVNYKNIATGLGHLAGDKVSKFFTMVGGLSAQTFDNMKALFNSLASIKKLPKEGGWWDNITGEETSTLSNIASELGGFGEKTKAFFTQVNSLNLNNLNGLWKSINSTKDITTNISKAVDNSINDIVKKVTELPKKMAEGVKSSGKSLSTAFVEVWKNAVTATISPVNKLISGANWILKEFGSKKVVADWKPYAKGTGGHKGGNALVNDGRGAEIVQMPNGHTFIPRGRNVFLPNAPKGMKVLSAENTANLLGRKSPTFRYADGNIDIWSFMDNAGGLIDSVKNKFVDYKGMSGLALHIGQGMVNTVSGEMSAWAKKLFDEFGALSLEAYNPSKGVSQWKSTVIRALKMEGLYSASNVARTLFQMQTESGGNPRAINLWDSNAKKGIPSKGLMQVIDPTFSAYAHPQFNKNIYDPLSNILASVRYAVSRYGSLEKAYRGVGYSSGVGTVSLPTQPNSMHVKYTPESSYQGGSAEVTENTTYAPVFNLTISGTNDDRAMARKVKRFVKEAIEETFESMNRRNPKLQTM